MTWVLSMLQSQAAAEAAVRRPGYAQPNSYAEPPMSPLFEGPAPVYSSQPAAGSSYAYAQAPLPAVPQRGSGNATPTAVAPVAAKQRAPKNGRLNVGVRKSASDLRQPAPDRSQQVAKSQSAGTLTPLRHAHAAAMARGPQQKPEVELYTYGPPQPPPGPPLPPPQPQLRSPGGRVPPQPQPQPHGNGLLQLEPLVPSLEEAVRLQREVERLEAEKGLGARQLQAALEQVRWLQAQVDRAEVERMSVRAQKEELEVRLRQKEAAEKRRVVVAVKEAAGELSNLKSQVREITKVLRVLLASGAEAPPPATQRTAAGAAQTARGGAKAGGPAPRTAGRAAVGTTKRGRGSGGGGGAGAAAAAAAAGAGVGQAEREATVARLIGEVNGLLSKIAARRGGGSPLARLFAEAPAGARPPDPEADPAAAAALPRPATGSSAGEGYEGGYPAPGQPAAMYPPTSRSVQFPAVAAPQGVYAAPPSAPVAQSWLPIGGPRPAPAYPPQPRGPPPRVAAR